jgi:MoxR-like ATPase
MPVGLRSRAPRLRDVTDLSADTDLGTALGADAAAVRAAVTRARAGLVDREVLTEVVALCAVAGEHLLVVGPPGTAKSEAVRRVAEQVGGAYFEYLLGRFTEPSEVFGPVDLRRLRDGVVAVETAGMLPEADIVFLDEVFLGSTAILNTLLGILNERTYRRGSTLLRCPLRVCVGATNRLPDDPALDAFADRFLARVFVDPVSDARLEELLGVGWGSASTVDGPGLLPAVDRLAAAARAVELAPVRGLLGIAVRRLRAAGVGLSDRRVVRAQRLVAAAATVDGRVAATAADLWVLPLVAPTAAAQALARETLADLLASASNASLLHAAEEYSRGPQARAARLAEAGTALLSALGPPPHAPDTLLALEATLREIDAGFEADAVPPVLAGVRERLVAEVRERAATGP